MIYHIDLSRIGLGLGRKLMWDYGHIGMEAMIDIADPKSVWEFVAGVRQAISMFSRAMLVALSSHFTSTTPPCRF